MKSPRTEKKVHNDCPFTREEILEMKAMLYSANTSHRCCNPAPIYWAVGYQEYEQMQQWKGHKERYKEWLENELKNLK